MDHADFYSDQKWCHTCDEYVSYLQSIEHAYCVSCGEKVRLFSEEDWSKFHAALQERKPRGRRPRKDKESA